VVMKRCTTLDAETRAGVTLYKSGIETDWWNGIELWILKSVTCKGVQLWVLKIVTDGSVYEWIVKVMTGQAAYN
jgi:hypothetical protein